MADELKIITTIENRIFTLRGQKVMIDRDLAELYGVETKKLNQSVKRNIKRFPDDFMFKLNDNELKELVTNCDRFNPPYAFTEQGVSMLSSVLNSDRAISINVEIIRTFVRLRQFAALQTSQNKEIEALRQMLLLHIDNTDNRFNEHEQAIKGIIDVLNSLVETPREAKQIGFKIK